MSSTDVVANMLVALRNAQRVGRERVVVPYSRFKEQLLHFLQTKGIIAAVRVQDGPRSQLIATFHSRDGEVRLHGTRRLSKPGRRVHVRWDSIPYVARGAGFVIVSTSQGLMDGETARRKHVGGEMICEIKI